jgi:hypothetical protein
MSSAMGSVGGRESDKVREGRMHQRIKRKSVEVLIDESDKLLTLAQLADRWQLNEDVARRRAKAACIPFVRLSRKIVRVRLSDVLRLEADAIAHLPPNFQSDFPDRLKYEEIKRAKRKAEATTK